MRLFGRVSRREREAMMVRLHELEREYAGTIGAKAIRETYIFYAIHGRDRKKIGMEWAKRAEEGAADAVQFEQLIAKAVQGQ